MSRRILSSVTRRFCSSSVSSTSDTVAAAFFHPEVQSALKALTSVDYSKIFRIAKRGQTVTPPSYAFMTNKELNAAKAEAHEKALRKLQMPPVMSPRVQKVQVLEDDPALKGSVIYEK